MTIRVAVRHNFETGHRLYQLGGKCQNLHGHSWWAEITVAGPLDANGVVVDFGTLKARLRQWIDQYLDHGMMLGLHDPLVPSLEEDGTKLFVFGSDRGNAGEEYAWDLGWPTVENVGVLLQRVAADALTDMGLSQARVVEVKVSETHLNSAVVGA